MLLTVLVERHDCDTCILAYSHLDVDPLIKRQEDLVRVRLEEVGFGVDIDTEARWRDVPEGEAPIKAEDMIFVAPNRWVRLKRMRA